MPPIHREGHRILLGLLVVLATINLGLYFYSDGMIVSGFSAGISIGVFLLVLQFFRNPQRKQNLHDDWILCPADGKIVVIEEVQENEYYKAKRKMVSVFMTPLNVHVNRYSFSGIVKYFKYHKGAYLVASHPKSSLENERTTVVVENGDRSIMLRQVAGYVARRIVTYCKVGENAVQGEEFGFIKFGSRVDIYMPLDAQIEVKLGQLVTGGITIIAKF